MVKMIVRVQVVAFKRGDRGLTLVLWRTTNPVEFPDRPSTTKKYM